AQLLTSKRATASFSRLSRIVDATPLVEEVHGGPLPRGGRPGRAPGRRAHPQAAPARAPPRTAAPPTSRICSQQPGSPTVHAVVGVALRVLSLPATRLARDVGVQSPFEREQAPLRGLRTSDLDVHARRTRIVVHVPVVDTDPRLREPGPP